MVFPVSILDLNSEIILPPSTIDKITMQKIKDAETVGSHMHRGGIAK